jgi:GTP-binding protein LepA
MERERIRNFCIIAHIDHGKSTLADRMLEVTGTLPAREMGELVLDDMELERERGITIKASAVRMLYKAQDSQEYELNLIDTPGHVDFTYEVSRALAACEGAILLVDASQGIEAQTLANFFLAFDQGLVLIPVVNKIDLPGAEPERVARELCDTFGFGPEEILFISAKEGTGVPQLLEAVIERIPPPKGDADAPLRALVFDSKYDPYKGVIAYVRVVDGRLQAHRPLRLMATGRPLEPLEVGYFRPQLVPCPVLDTGEVGYVATGLKSVGDCRVGDTITYHDRPASQPLPGYRPAKPMVFAGLYPADSEDYQGLREALEKLRLNDAALYFEPESSLALGPGFRCGFLGLLHMDIVQERLEREFGMNILVTAPSVEYRVFTTDGRELVVRSPADLPPPHQTAEIREPWMDVSIITPDRYIGAIMELVTGRRGEFKHMEYLDQGLYARQGERRVLLEFRMPLSEMLVDFYDQLKSRTQGYASMDYSFAEYRPGKLVKLDILVNQQPVDALSLIVPQEKAYQVGRALVEKLRELIPRQLFEVAIQAAIGSRVIARSTIKALRKNVLAKCYGGDVTRKKKLLERQKEGKKRLRRIGRVEVPQEAFLALLKLEL